MNSALAPKPRHGLRLTICALSNTWRGRAIGRIVMAASNSEKHQGDDQGLHAPNSISPSTL